VDTNGDDKNAGNVGWGKIVSDCQAQTRDHALPSQGRVRSSGVRTAYFTRLAAIRQGLIPAIEPEALSLSALQARRFLALARQITRRLAVDFKRAALLLEEPQAQARRFLKRHALLAPPELTWAPEHLVGIAQPLRRRWRSLWQAPWQQAEQEHLARLWPLLRPDRLLVTQVAPAGASDADAREKLRKRLERDRQERPWQVPSPEMFLYEESLENWLLRPLLSGQWLFRLCQALADLARDVPEQVRQCAARQKTKKSAATHNAEEPEDAELAPAERASGATATGQQRGARPSLDTRRLPPLPRGVVTAEAIFYYTVSAWRSAAGSAGADPILPDAKLLPLAQFQALLALAVKVTEHLLWSDDRDPLARADDPAERRRLLREMLLSPRRSRRAQWLTLRERKRHLEARANALSPWMAWEEALRAGDEALKTRLAASVVPEEITPARLETLLRAPAAQLARHYLYQTSLGDALRAALPAPLPNGAALLLFCRDLAREVGAWPPRTPGAPADADLAGLAICFYCKLALADWIDPLEPTPESDRLPPPRRASGQDGAQVSWLDVPLSPEALEMASLLAPLITRVLHTSSCAAANEDKPLLAARLKNEEPEIIDRLDEQLRKKAWAINHSNRDEAVFDAWLKLRQQLEGLVLPAQVTLTMFSSKLKVDTLDISSRKWYTVNQPRYLFLGEIEAFALSLIRRRRTTRALPKKELKEEQPETQTLPNTSAEDDQAALLVLRLIVQARQGRLPSKTAESFDARDARLLVRGLFTNHTGRSLVRKWRAQGKPVALAITQLWLADSSQRQGAPPPTLTSAERMRQLVALTRLLEYEAVKRSPAMRRAIADLFGLPMSIEERDHTTRPPLGALERIGAWVTRPRLREEILPALESLGQGAKTQRWAVCARLLERQQIRLMLALLERSGWQRPLWLKPATLQRAAAGDDFRGSPQIFLVGQRGWLKRLARFTTANPAWARALTGEWLGLHFWSGLFERLDQARVMAFYHTLLSALPTRLRRVIGAAWAEAKREKLAYYAEVIGLTGALPPDLPAQLDRPAFFQAMQRQLPTLPGTNRRMTSAEATAAEALALRRLRQELKVARWRVLAWFVAIAGVKEDNERNVLLAAMSLADGNADQLGGWIEGQSLAQVEVAALARQLKGWRRQLAIPEEQIGDLLCSAVEQVRPVWRQLRRER